MICLVLTRGSIVLIVPRVIWTEPYLLLDNIYWDFLIYCQNLCPKVRETSAGYIDRLTQEFRSRKWPLREPCLASAEGYSLQHVASGSSTALYGCGVGVDQDFSYGEILVCQPGAWLVIFFLNMHAIKKSLKWNSCWNSKWFPEHV